MDAAFEGLGRNVMLGKAATEGGPPKGADTL